jgi:hypothetical protein
MFIFPNLPRENIEVEDEKFEEYNIIFIDRRDTIEKYLNNNKHIENKEKFDKVTFTIVPDLCLFSKTSQEKLIN